MWGATIRTGASPIRHESKSWAAVQRSSNFHWPASIQLESPNSWISRSANRRRCFGGEPAANIRAFRTLAQGKYWGGGAPRMGIYKIVQPRVLYLGSRLHDR